MNDTYLKAWDSMPPKRPEKLSAYLGKIVRNLSLNRFRRYAAEKRGFGQTELVLSELEDCIPSAVGVEQAFDETLLVDAINRFLREQPGAKAEHLYPPILVSVSDKADCGKLWHEREQGGFLAFQNEKRAKSAT